MKGARRRDPALSSLLMFGTSGLVQALSLWNVLVTSRALGVAGRGQIAFLLTVGLLSSQMATFGVQEANVNLAGQDRQRTRALAGNSVVLAAVLGSVVALVVAALVMAVPALGGGASPVLLTLVLLLLPMLVLHSYLTQILVAQYRFTRLNLAALLTPMLNATINTALALSGAISVASTVGVWLTGQFLSTALLGWTVWRAEGFGRPDRRLARECLGFGARAHLGRTMNWGSYRADQWVVGVIAGDELLGLYSIAVAWSEALFLLPQVLQTVMRPDLVRATAKDAQRQVATTMRLGVLLTVPAVILLMVAAPFLCVTLMGQEFAGSVTPLRVLALGSFGVLALKVYGSTLLARGRPLLDSIALAPVLLVMLGLDVYLVPKWGALGAAAASSTAYLVGGVIGYLVCRQVLGGRLRELMPRPYDVHVLVTLVRTVLRKGQRQVGAARQHRGRADQEGVSLPDRPSGP